MSGNASIIDPFHRRLATVLSEDVDNRMTSLAAGAAGSYEDYKYQTGYIQALTDVMEKCRELEVEQYGRRPGADAEQQ